MTPSNARTLIAKVDSLRDVLSMDPVLAKWVDSLEDEDSFFQFVPRPDDPANFDEQHGFSYNRDQVAFLVGGNACMSPKTLVDMDDGTTAEMGELGFRKGVEPMFRIGLSNGESFIASRNHVMLRSFGEWRCVSELSVGDSLALSGRIRGERLQFDSQAHVPSSLPLYVPSCLRTFEGYQDRCSKGHCLHGGRLRAAIDSDQSFLPSQGGVDARIPQRFCLDDPVIEQGYTRSCRPFVHRSNYRFSRRAHQLVGGPCPTVSVPCSQSSGQADTHDQDYSSNTSATEQTKVRRQSPESSCPTDTLIAFGTGAKDSVSSFYCLPSVNITSIDHVGQGEVFDVHVPVHNGYSAASVVHHNSGTTECAAFKTANFLLNQQAPPRHDTPFWIISNTYDQVCDVCWLEKLIGHNHIPDCEIEWDRVSWLSEKAGKPRAVPLKPWPTELGGTPSRNWRLEFKSYEQQRQAMQARSIGGFWFSEQFPLDLFLEVLRGCREYMFDGGQFAEFTPIEPELSIWVEKAMEEPPPGWRFYRCNTEKNIPNLKDGWYEQFFAMVPDEMMETRRIGSLASFEGVIYPSFNRYVHVRKAEDIEIPPGVVHAMGTDWGASAEHPHTTVWAYRDGMGNWIVYDEYWSADQTAITVDHVDETLDRCEAWGWPVKCKDERRFIQTNALWHQNYADPSRPGEIAEYNRRGIPTGRGRNQVYEGINEVRRLLKTHPATNEPALVISDKCTHLIEELRKYRWKKGQRPESGRLLNPAVANPIPLKRDDDTVDSLRYLVFSEALFTGEVISSTAKTETPLDRRSIQIARKRFEVALSRSTSGMMPQNGHSNGNGMR